MGNKYKMTDILQMVDEKGMIKNDDKLYQEFAKGSKYCLLSYYFEETAKNNKPFLPILCEYGG